jgi:hypothetical protein
MIAVGVIIYAASIFVFSREALLQAWTLVVASRRGAEATAKR